MNMFRLLKLAKSFFNIGNWNSIGAFHNSELIYRNLVEHSLMGIYIIQDNLFKYVNERWCEIHGYTYDEVVDKVNPLDIVYFEDRELVKENIRKRIAGSSNFVEYEFRIVRKDKKVIWVKVHGSQTIYNKKPAITGTFIDYTDQKFIEASLHESEAKYRSLVEHSLVGVYIIQDNLFRYVNRHFGDIFGYTTEEIIDKLNPSVFVLSDDKKIVEDNIRKRIDGKTDSIEYDFRGIKKDGSIINIRVLGNLMVFKGKPAISGTLVDFTYRKLMEEALRKSERRLRTIIDTIPDLMWLKDSNGLYLQCNQRFEQLYGVPEIEILGKTDYDFVDSQLADFFQQNDNAAKEAGKSTINEEEVTFADGHKEILETIKTPIFEDDGAFIGVLGIGRDITERKKAENELKESEELFKILLKLAPYPIVLTDLNNRYILVNDAYFNINSVTDTNVIGKTPAEIGIVFNAASEENIKKEMISKGKVENLELEAIVRNGERKEFLYSSVVIQWKNKPMILHSSIDITDKKKSERELEKYREQLELLVRERTDELKASFEELHTINEELFARQEELQNTINTLNATKKQLIQSEKMASLGVLSSGIAHEINNPLNFIYGGSLALQDYFEEKLKGNIEEISPFLEAINEGVNRATQIVTSLSHYSRRDDLPRVECDMNSVIDNCLIMLQNQLKGKVEVIKQYTSERHSIFGNEGKLHQAILNIIANAEQAIEKEGTIEIETNVSNNQLVIIIKDSGAGIKTEVLEKIFDPFFTTKPPGKGTGLGLSITFNIIQEHKGNIEYESELGKGTKAIVTLPICI